MLREKFTENLNYSQFFSFEVLDYFNSICTDENYEWIVKYFNVLMKEENKTAEKFNNHHIRLAFTFRDDNHKNRKETKSLANEVNGNIIRLSVQNHIKAHNYLRFIFKNTIYEGYARSAIYIICRKRNVENFTESEIDEIAKIIEDCAKENKTKEERKQYDKQWYLENRDRLLERGKAYAEANKEKRSANGKKWYKENKERHDAWQKEWNNNHKEERKESSRKWRENNRDNIRKNENKRNVRMCIDPTNGTTCTYGTLRSRKKRNKEKYKDVKPIECLVKTENQQ